MARIAVLPVPTPRKVRPGARRLMVAMALAVTGAMRKAGIATPEPTRIATSDRRRGHHGPQIRPDHGAVPHPAEVVADLFGPNDQIDLVDLTHADPELHPITPIGSLPTPPNSPPVVGCGVGHQPQLGPLFVLGDQVALEHAGKATLWAEGQSIASMNLAASSSGA